MKRRNLPGFAILFGSVALATWILIVTSTSAEAAPGDDLRDRVGVVETTLDAGVDALLPTGAPRSVLEIEEL